MSEPLTELFAAGGPTRVMGIVNVTPDSFSDGGAYPDPTDAVRAGQLMVEQGADLVDVGGESTRPGAPRVVASEELRRVLPVVATLAAAGVPVSIDTSRASVAAAAVDSGAVLVNDVSCGMNAELLRIVADRGVHYVLMHSRGSSAQMGELAVYDDVVTDVVSELAARLEVVLAAGIAEDRVIIDPGIGFAKTAAHNWALLADLGPLAALGRPLLVGTSRKTFLGAVLHEPGKPVRPPVERDDATQATTVLLAAAGVWAVRVHAVRPAVDGIRVERAWRSAAAAAATAAASVGRPAAPFH
ncbi:dihydropteroate synthase [Frankia sp. CcI49]|uniref:dihydropteroate synthase n=1 Tax=Frankia sp. CcI49 TaxID=1745382 RepID=UPI00097701EA|nr:dihydropteroate synthase [Frankia sp. CcI49]ONH58525.1 dihydropteroate synthase [Frankia sp. CcI49]